MSGITRDFSESRKNELRAQVKAVAEDGQWWLFDEVGDICSWFSTKFGELQIENYLTRIDEYHKKIIDQKDITGQELEKIFDAVECLNNEYEEKYRELNEGFRSHIDSLIKLSELINPVNNIFTSESVKKAGDLINKNIETGCAKIDEIFDAELDYMQMEALKNSAKELTGDILSIGVNVMTFAADVASGNMVGAGVNGWQVINDTCSLLGDVSALAGIGICIGIGEMTGGKGKNKERKRLLENAENDGSMEGVSGVLKNNGMKELATVAEAVDCFAGAYEIYDSAKGIVESTKKLNKVVHDGRYNKADRIKEMLLEEVGYKNTDNPYKYVKDSKVPAKIMKSITDSKNIWSNAQNVYKFTKSFTEGKLADEILDTTSGGGLVSDVKDCFEDAEDFIKDIFSLNGFAGGAEPICMLN